ncbi:hypothetical protein M8994_05560 [Brucella sp. 21LCYQ03]|nr:hypothetical protein [Brucella sp. 21LCYQ03]
MKKYAFGLTVITSLIFAAPTLAENALEELVLPGGFTVEKWNDFADNGGLNNRSSSSIYGLDVLSMRPALDGDKLDYLDFNVSRATAPNTIKEAAQKVCAGDGADWEITRDNGRQFGELKADKCSARYIIYEGQDFSVLIDYTGAILNRD